MVVVRFTTRREVGPMSFTIFTPSASIGKGVKRKVKRRDRVEKTETRLEAGSSSTRSRHNVIVLGRRRIERKNQGRKKRR